MVFLELRRDSRVTTGDFRVPLVSALGSPTFYSSGEGKLGVALESLQGHGRSPTHRPGSQEGGWGLGSCPGEGALRRRQSQVKGAGTVWKATLASRGSSWTWQGEE